MTVEQPLNSAHVWLVNATHEPVDVYVNYADKPAITDVKSLAIGPEFKVVGKDSTPYGTYTFSVRPKAEPNAPVLAAVSVAFEKGKSFTAVLQPTRSGGRQFSVYENDFSASGAGRMTVRHNAEPAEIEWTITPLKAEIPSDPRNGTLGSGQWQVATEVPENSYRLETLVGGMLVAVHPDLALEHEKDRTVYVVGDPRPTSDPRSLEEHVLEQEFQLPAGPAQPGEVTAPAAPVRTTDENAAIEFRCEPIEGWQANPAITKVSAVDPDGVVTNLSIAAVVPEGAHIRIGDLTPADGIGAVARAVVEVLADVAPGAYDVTVEANRGSLGHRATCVLTVIVKPITVGRLGQLVDDYEGSGDIGGDVADALRSSLDLAQQDLDAGQTSTACQDLKDLLTQLNAAKGTGITVPAHDHLERETKALRSNLGCG